MSPSKKNITTMETGISIDSESETATAGPNEHTNFINAIHSILNKLMHKYGYSRERATKAIVQEFNRSVSPSAIVITDNELYDTMRRYRLGSEQASRALTVSKVLDCMIIKRGLSTQQSLALITKQLNEAKLHRSDVYDSDSSSSVEDYESSSEQQPSASGVRIVVPEPPVPKATTTQAIATKTISANEAAPQKQSRKRAATKANNPSTRTATPLKQQATTVESSASKRARADSVADEVAAKYEEATGATATASGATNISNSNPNTTNSSGTNVGSANNNKGGTATPVVVGRSTKRARVTSGIEEDQVQSSLGNGPSSTTKRARRGGSS